MEIVVSQAPTRTAATKLEQMLLRSKETPVLLLLSGGSALSWLDKISTEALNSQLTITTLDERFSTDTAVNNFAQIKATKFYTQAMAKGVNVIATTIAPDDTLAMAGKRFATALQNWREQHPKGVMLATLGVGSDGHTAGIMAGDYGVDFSAEAWVVAYEVPKSVNPYPKRITVTYTFLQTQIKEALVYVVGKEKQAIIQKIQSPACDCQTIPASILRKMSKVCLVTDQY